MANHTCKYCGCSVKDKTVCASCWKKLKYIRKIIAIGKLIKERAKNDTVCDDNKKYIKIDVEIDDNDKL